MTSNAQSDMTAGTYSPGYDEESSVLPSQESVAGSKVGRNINWGEYANGSGLVDVVVVLQDSESAQSPRDELAGLLSVGASEEGSKASPASAVSTIKKEYSLAFRGASLRLSVETILDLQSRNDSILLYPDYQVGSMVGSNIQQVGADEVWTYVDPQGAPVKGTGVVVAVIDTGVDYTHPDLGGGFGPGYKVIGGYDFCNNDNDPIDDNGHGTHVAGIIAASGGSEGVAPGASILAYKVLDDSGSGTMSDVIDGIEAAMDPNGDGDTSDHADVASLSLGGAGELGDPMCIAVENAVQAGVVVVVAAGNSGPSMGTVSSPGISPDAITVGAVDGSDSLADFSSRGVSQELEMKPDISAPGVSILSTVPFSGTEICSPTGYTRLSGTSMATPHVSGAAALLLQLHPDLSPKEVRSALVTGSDQIDEPLWHAGAGRLWAPSAAQCDLYVSEPIISLGIPDGVAESITISNDGVTSDFTLAPSDFRSLMWNTSVAEPVWTNQSSVSPTQLTISSGSIQTVGISIDTGDTSKPEGYYEGVVLVQDGSRSLRIRFGYAILSSLTVHVLDNSGREITDLQGGVLVYGIPDAAISRVKRGLQEPCPPASFFLPAGDYSAHALGYQVFYDSSDPYILSGTVSLARAQSVNLYLRLADAREMILQLTTEDGHPIYVNDFLMYVRYTGTKNVSMNVMACDTSIQGDEVFNLPTSRRIRVSDTEATVGISVVGYSYSADMWEFMSRNSDHWYEYPGITYQDYFIEASADLEYLLAWEFPGIDYSAPRELEIDETKSSEYDVKYDIPGTIANVWACSGTHSSVGGEAARYLRQESYSSLNPFFTGLSRRVIVQGVFSELYWPGSLTGNYVVNEFYVPDFNHTVESSTDSHIIFPNRNTLLPIEGAIVEGHVSVGPFYPSVATDSDNSTLVITYPLIRDQLGGRVLANQEPYLYLYRGGSLNKIVELVEHRSTPSPKRLIPLYSSGSYLAEIPITLGSQVSGDIVLRLGFTVPSMDPNPPVMKDFSMPQRFLPGESVDLQFAVVDDNTISNAKVSWRPTASASWIDLTVDAMGSGVYASSIQTSASNTRIDLKIKVDDSFGNYLEYVVSNASLKQVPVIFDIVADKQEFDFIDGDISVLLTGRLTCVNGSSLHPKTSIPLELMLGERKVATILDEYVESGSHSDNGTIRFEWHFNPTILFETPNRTVDIQVAFDLGIYEPISRTISLSSVKVGSYAPSIHLLSPTNGSLIPAGEVIDLNIRDDGSFIANVYLDDVNIGQLDSPFDINTSSWAEGAHALRIVATDDESLTSAAVFSFGIDAFAPSVQISYPKEGSHVPSGSALTADVYDSNLEDVSISIDYGTFKTIYPPFAVDMTGWLPGDHNVRIAATDKVGHYTVGVVSFSITSGSVAITVENPPNGSVINSGIPIVFSVVGVGTVTATWSEVGVQHYLGTGTEIATIGWTEGLHNLQINATNEFNESDEIAISIVIDDTPPEIVLVSPSNRSFVIPSDNVTIDVFDLNLMNARFVIWGNTSSTSGSRVTIPLASSPYDGSFVIEVNATDKAGNSATATLEFCMDSSPPALSVDGLAPGDAIGPGQVIDVSAEDLFLSDVRWSLDENSLQTLEFPYDISTDGLSAGWHEFEVVATDYSGKQSVLNISLYVDTTAPAVQVMPVGVADSLDRIDIRATVSDDYAVDNVTLYYEFQNGSYGAMAMMLNGTEYVAELTTDVLWDGMIVYVVAEDTVGNFGESSHITISGEALPDNSRDDSSKDGPISWLWFGTQSGLLTLGFIAAASILTSVFMVGRRRSPTEEESDELLSFGPVRENIRPNLHSVEPPLSVPPTPIALVASAPLQSVKPVHVTAARPPHGAPKKTLIDAIPEMVLMPGIPTEDPEDDIDYGEMIERELDLSAFKKSVFREEIREEDVDREFEALFGGPQIISGLMLKRLMDLDMEKM